MSEEIVRRLRNRSKKELAYLRESMPLHGLREEDEEDIDDEEVDNEEQEDVDTPESPSIHKKDSPEEDVPDEEDFSEEDIDSPPSHEEEPPHKENVNPLDNAYAVKYTLGDEVVLAYSDGTNSKMKGVIDGYDKEGFYRIRWGSGLTTNGITDIALVDMIQDIQENKCVCGGTHLITEGRNLVCDTCGRIIKESSDPLMLADKSRPKGKKMIRSEAHPISTAIKPSISEAIKKAFKSTSINEAEDEEDIESDEENLGVFNSLHSLEGSFWTRLPELVEDIRDLGFIVDEANDEYIIITTDSDEEESIQIFIGGTANTKTLDFNRIRGI